MINKDRMKKNNIFPVEVPLKHKVSFNFFKDDKCGSFKFSKACAITHEQLCHLLDLTPEQRLEELSDWLAWCRYGKSCEFYYAGEFYKVGKTGVNKEKMAKARAVKLGKA